MTDEIQTIEQKTNPKSILALRQEDWYQSLTDDIGGDVVETEFDVNYRVIELYHRLGQKIAENTDNFKRANVYGKSIAKTIGEDINRHPSVVRRAMQFYEQAPDLQKFLSDKPKNLSWTKIRKEYLPNKKATGEISEAKKEEVEVDKSKSIRVMLNTLDVAIFTPREHLDLFLNILNEPDLTNSKVISQVFLQELERTFQTDEIKALITDYSQGKTEKEINFLKELEVKDTTPSNSAKKDNVPTQNNSLIVRSRPTLAELRVANEEQPTNITPLQQLVSQYKTLYKNKFNREPVVGPASYGKWGKLLKIKMSQGYSIDEIISLLQLFVKSKDSEKLAFDPGVLLSDFVFNKMLSVKSKNSNVVMEDKYAKF